MKNSFILYTNYYEILKDLPESDLGIIFKAILQYQATNKIPKMPKSTELAFKFIKNQLDVDTKKYNEFVEKQSINGKKGGRPKKDEENPKNPSLFLKTQKSHNDNVNENDNENQNVNENVNLNVNVNVNENVNENGNGNENADSDQEKGKRELFQYSSEPETQMIEKRESFHDTSDTDARITNNSRGFHDSSDIKDKKENEALSYKPYELTDKDMTILENYVKRRKLVKKNVKAYVRKIISNGDHVRILEEEKMRLEMAEMQNYHSPSQKQIEAELASIHDKKSAFQVLARYYNALADYPPPLEEIAEHYKLNNSQAMADYQLELITNKTREELDKMKPFKPETRMYEKVLAKELAQEGYNNT